MALIENKDVKFHFEKKDDATEYVIVLDSPLLFHIDDTAYIIEKGYRCDGMSVPRGLWSVISPQYSPVTLFPSICHDWLYDTHVVSRKKADDWYCIALVENGYPTWKARLVHNAVRMFGKNHW